MKHGVKVEIEVDAWDDAEFLVLINDLCECRISVEDARTLMRELERVVCEYAYQKAKEDQLRKCGKTSLQD